LSTQAASKQYLRDEILTASPEKLILMLYDGAIKRLQEALRRIEEKDPFEFTQNITKAEAILAELTGAIKQDHNPEVSINLLRLYDFCYQELIDSLRTKKAANIENVIKILKDLRETWIQAIPKAAEEAPFIPKTETKPLPTKRPSLSFEA
jgi:flagellar secretion chaperone FliS